MTVLHHDCAAIYKGGPGGAILDRYGLLLLLLLLPQLPLPGMSSHLPPGACQYSLEALLHHVWLQGQALVWHR
jgi:hypothetical protein